MRFWLVCHIFRGFGGNAVSQIKGLPNWFFGFEHFDDWVPQCLSWAYIPLFHWGMSKTCLKNHFSIYKARHQLPLFYSSLNKKPKQSQLWKEFHLCATKTVDTINCCSLVKVESSRLKAVVWWWERCWAKLSVWTWSQWEMTYQSSEPSEKWVYRYLSLSQTRHWDTKVTTLLEHSV